MTFQVSGNPESRSRVARLQVWPAVSHGLTKIRTLHPWSWQSPGLWVFGPSRSPQKNKHSVSLVLINLLYLHPIHHLHSPHPSLLHSSIPGQKHIFSIDLSDHADSHTIQHPQSSTKLTSWTSFATFICSTVFWHLFFVFAVMH